MRISRRSLLGGVLAAPVAGSAWPTLVEPRLLEIRHRTLTLPHMPAAHGPLRIVFLTDLHVGCPHVTLDRTAALVEQANALSPDVILLGGDYVVQGVVGGRFVPPEDTARVLGGLRAPRGVYTVLGNHDWWLDGWRVRKAFEAAGIPVLENEAIVLPEGPKMWLAGLADEQTRTPDMAATLAGVPEDEPVVVLAHNPATFATVPERALVTLCGHTHGGQVSLPFYGPLVNATKSPLRWTYGHIVEDGRNMIVSAGIGTSVLPIRFNMPPEITVVDLIPAAAAEALAA